MDVPKNIWLRFIEFCSQKYILFGILKNLGGVVKYYIAPKTTIV